MWHFKKNLMKNLDSSSKVLSPPSIVLNENNSFFCYGEVIVSITTNKPVKVNIISNFAVGGSYTDTGSLTGINKKNADVLNEEITSDTTYNFGIDGAQSGNYTNYSEIVITVNDFDTSEVISLFRYSRLHANTPC